MVVKYLFLLSVSPVICFTKLLSGHQGSVLQNLYRVLVHSLFGVMQGLTGSSACCLVTTWHSQKCPVNSCIINFIAVNQYIA